MGAAAALAAASVGHDSRPSLCWLLLAPCCRWEASQRAGLAGRAADRRLLAPWPHHAALQVGSRMGLCPKEVIPGCSEC